MVQFWCNFLNLYAYVSSRLIASLISDPSLQRSPAKFRSNYAERSGSILRLVHKFDRYLHTVELLPVSAR